MIGQECVIKIRNNIYNDKKRYNSYRNKLNSLLKLAEKKHYEILIEENKNNFAEHTESHQRGC